MAAPTVDILIEELEGSLWTAALQDGRLIGLEIDPPDEIVRWGAVYWARVASIDAGMDAAYLDLGDGVTGLLYNKDVRFRDDNGKIIKGGDIAIGKRFSPGDTLAVQAKTAYMPKEGDPFTGQEHKIPQMSMDITLPGRYLIYCPLMTRNRISQRIQDKKLRKQINAMLNDLDEINGCIVRSAAASAQTEILLREGKILKAAWDQMQDHFSGSEPALIMAGPDAVERTLSDQADKTIETIEVVTMDHYNHVEEWAGLFAPDLVTKIQPLELEDAFEDLALFHYRDIIGQIEDLFQSYVLLPGGGNLILQQTAALLAIDVNRGGDKRGNLAINQEAAEEIARQLRLRNIGGIIMADFLNLKSGSEQTRLEKALAGAMMNDPCTVQIHGMTKLGLIEMSRKRRTAPLQDRMAGIFL